MTVAPARTCRAYVSGERKTTPLLGYLSLSAAFTLLLFAYQSDSARDELRAQLVRDVDENQAFAQVLRPSQIDRYVDLQFDVTEATLPYQLILMAAPLVLMLRLFFRRPFNLAEIGVFVLYTTAHSGFFTAVFSLLLSPWLGAFNAAWVILFFVAIYQGVVAQSFFGIGRVRAIAVLVFALLATTFLYSLAMSSAILMYVAFT